MKGRAGSINHNHVFPALNANGVRHPWRDHNACIVVTAMIVTVDKEAHHAPRQACPDVAQNHFNPPLQKEHDIPLLVIVAAKRILFWFIDEQAAQPIRRSAALGNAGRMYVETFFGVPKHSRSRPLLRPKANTRKNPFVAPYKFAEESAMTLWVNLSCENFQAWDRCFFDPALRPVRGQQFAGLNAPLSKLLRKRRTAIIASGQRAAGARINALPKIFFSLGHETNVILSEPKLQRSGRNLRGQAFNLGSFLGGGAARKGQRCLKAWPHASHFVAALRST